MMKYLYLIGDAVRHSRRKSISKINTAKARGPRRLKASPISKVVMSLGIILIFIMASQSGSAGTYPRCVGGCDANDVTIDGFTLSISPCTSGETKTATLYMDFSTHRTNVYCVKTAFDVYLDGELIENGNIVFPLGDFDHKVVAGSAEGHVQILSLDYPCGSSVLIKNIYADWDQNAPKPPEICGYLADPPYCQGSATSKCYTAADQYAVIPGIQVTKKTVGNCIGGTDAFPITVSGTGGSMHPFGCNDPAHSWVLTDLGTYTVSEAVPDGWELTSIQCTDKFGTPITCTGTRSGNSISVTLTADVPAAYLIFTNTKKTAPDLKVEKKGIQNCDKIGYTIKYSNIGDDFQTGTTLVDTYDPAIITPITPIPDGGQVSDPPGNIAWTIPDSEVVVSGGEHTRTWTGKLTNGGCVGIDVLNKVDIQGTKTDKDLTNNHAEDTVKVVPDKTAPVLPTLPTGGDLGCNPETLPSCVEGLKAIDACDGEVAVICTAGAITDVAPCGKKQEFVYSAKDLCGNEATKTVTYTWKVDKTVPELPTTIPTDKDLGCNPETLPSCVEGLKAIDACDGEVAVICTAGAITDVAPCGKKQEFVYSAKDLCGNEATKTVTYTWKVDKTVPELPTTIPTDKDLGCNPETLPSCVEGLKAIDACDGEVAVICTAGAITDVAPCGKKQEFVYSAKDLCGNEATKTVTYTWKVDKTVPELPTTIPTDKDLGCNPETLPSCVEGLKAIDACDGEVAVICTAGAITDVAPCGKKQEFVYSAKDLCGNEATKTVTYTWKVDKTVPELPTTIPTDKDLGCNPETLPSCVEGLKAIDACDGEVAVICTAGAITDVAPCGKKQEFVYSAKDLCGNEATKTVTYTWKVDKTVPELPTTIPTDKDLGCNPETLPSCVEGLKAIDACDGEVAVICTAGAITDVAPCGKKQEFVYSAKDLCGNEATKTVTYTWKVDKTVPELPTTIPTDKDLGCNPETLPSCVEGLKAIDACDGEVAVICTAGAITDVAPCGKKQEFVYSAKDLCGNEATKTVTYTWKVDKTVPELPTTIPTDKDLGCNPETLPSCVEGLKAIDACDGEVAVICTAGAITDVAPCGKKQEFVYSAKDLCGNEATKTVTYTWKVDKTVPELPTTIPTDKDLGCNPETLPSCVEGLKAIDACDGEVAVICTAGAITDVAPCGKKQEFVYSAKDLCGNEATKTVTYTWKVDKTVPELPTTIPTDKDLGCNPETLPSCVEGLKAIDACDGEVAVICTAGAITDVAPCGKKQEFVYSAKDLCGNEATKTVTYTWKVDKTVPELPTTIPTDKDLGCNPETLPSCVEGLKAIDACDGEVAVICTAGAITDVAPCGKKQEFVYSAKDLCGNEATKTVTYTWKVDKTVPELPTTIPTDKDLGCNPETLPSCVEGLKAIDACDGEVAVICTAGAITDVAPCGKKQEFVYSAKDLCGNEATKTVTYTWKVDKTVPELPTTIPTDKDLGCNPETLPSCVEGLKAIDACDGEVAVICTAGAITDVAPCGKKQEFVYSAKDLCGNEATKTVTYTWKVDKTVPELPTTIPTDKDLGCNPETLPSCVEGLKAIDACDGEVAVICTAGAITDVAPCGKKQEFVYSAKDLCGNEATKTVTYTWKEDLTGPVLAGLPTGGDLGCNPTLPSCDPEVTATDACDGEVEVTCTPGEIVEEGAKRSQVFTYSAIDSCGNLAKSEVTYTWIESNPAIHIDKRADVTSAKPGQTINYTYNVTNTGNVDLSSVEVTDDNLDVNEVEVKPNSIDSGGDGQ